ncbi:MAG TPA: hypothetical protein VFE50_16185 [Cyclobacteriaceae bacterium]|nr:hypothetical protein [Cyclobacteriaceae bacterium]
MRIGQLARQLGISPSDISGFLATQNIDIEAGANARLTDDVLAKVLQNFAPEKKVEEIVQEEEPVVKEESPKLDETLPVEPVEVIRVTKVELQGLKVVGKIDLPEPKKKEDAPLPAREPRKEQPRREQRAWKNPMEQKRVAEAREKEKKKQEDAERLKEKRTNHYYSKVKSVPTKPARKIEEQTVVEDLEVKEPPKTLVGRFLRWLTT